MNRLDVMSNRALFLALACLIAQARPSSGADRTFYVSPTGIDDASHTLYYMPMGEGHPDTLDIAAPVLGRLIQIKGTSREACVENLAFDGLALAGRGKWRPTR